MTDEVQSRFAPIAIVGRACVVPGALSPDELWQAVVTGTDLITAVDDDRWGVDRDAVICDPSGDSRDRTWSDRGGYGLVGMEERVRSPGGQIAVGPAPQNTWSVVARIPSETPRATPSHVVDPTGDGTPGGRSD